MVRAVVDTNVVVSGILTQGTPRRIYKKFKEGKCIFILSPIMFEELIRVLTHPKFHNIIDKQCSKEVIYFIQEFAEFVIPTEKFNICRDPEDNHLLSCAAAAKPEYLVSGDKDLLVLSSFHNIPIITPANFLKLLKK